MNAADEIKDHQVRCEPHLLMLRMLSRDPAGAVLPQPILAEVRRATSAVIIEAEAAGRAALATAAGGLRHQGARTFLQVRLNRLMTAADAAITAAQEGNSGELRRQLHRFDALTSAIWAVQHAVSGPASPRPVRRGAVPAIRQQPA